MSTCLVISLYSLRRAREKERERCVYGHIEILLYDECMNILSE